ncbi:MAG: Uma2 family endonuclease [Halieaceae bacterium]|nr:Uma2 family endonuclease [Halieaceae bacterium]
MSTTRISERHSPKASPRTEGSQPQLPRLEPGDRLTRYEFERRYEAMPQLKKAELIEGVVNMPSPVKNTHGESHGTIMVWLGSYCVATPGLHLNDNTSIRLDLDNEPQPDALLRLDSSHGGTSRVGIDDYIEGPPELIVEIAASSASYDLHDKLRVYRRHGVQEYVVWRIMDRQIDWFALEQGRYLSLAADEHGVLRSQVFPGLWLDVPALLEGDLAGVLAMLQQGLAGEEHNTT